ncbi:MAG: UDP-N-acetylmuramoyl-tripeptide--D-alanyl-D-alanine ligase [Oscillospiraceae bacterium]|nr:UDP-N-acetylmuramoyl-tripeptide--D-alanyl-D-alanine ligase [Candidatus Equicaccousia limihippi]
MIKAIFTTLILIGGPFSAQRHIQMYQQNSYYLSRYCNWGKDEIGFKTYVSLAFAALLTFFFFINEIVFAILAVLVTAVKIFKAFYDRKTSIKKLVYSKRIKRLLGVYIAVIVLIALLLFIFANTEAVLYLGIFSIAISMLPTVIFLPIAALMSLVEKAIALYYKKDAEKILASMPSLKVIGVTGSFGKTSVKFILKQMLSEKYNVCATPESFNTPLGLIRTVRENLKSSDEIFIAEMGAKNIGDIKELCELVKPTMGIITAVGPQHLESFKTVQNVVNTKFELDDYCHNTYVNYDSEDAKERANIGVCHTYGTAGFEETHAENISYDDKGVSFDIVHFDTRFNVTSKLLGNHNIANIIGAAAVALELGVSPQQIKFAVSKLNAPEHRLEKKSFLNGSLLIDDSYNSNPVGSAFACEVIKSFSGKKRIIVTPGLVELGEKEEEFNKTFGKKAAESCDILIFVGEKRSVPLAEGAKESDVQPGETLVVKNFKEAMEKLKLLCDNDTVVLFENDLPDNYAK